MKLSKVFLVFSLFLTACNATNLTPQTRVAYLVQPGGHLSQADLVKHPEIFVTSSFNEFRQAARNRIALWIDKNATQLVEEGWLDEMPQASYPIVLVGYNAPWYAFGLQLEMCCFLGGPIGFDLSELEPGFSVIKRESGEFAAPITMLQGFKETPSVDAILKISNDLLDGKIVPTPSATLRPGISSPTPPPNPFVTP